MKKILNTTKRKTLVEETTYIISNEYFDSILKKEGISKYIDWKGTRPVDYNYYIYGEDIDCYSTKFSGNSESVPNYEVERLLLRDLSIKGGRLIFEMSTHNTGENTIAVNKVLIKVVHKKKTQLT